MDGSSSSGCSNDFRELAMSFFLSSSLNSTDFRESFLGEEKDRALFRELIMNEYGRI